MKIALFNDTSLSPHAGCLAVSNAHDGLLGGHEVVARRFVTELRDHWSGDEEESICSVLNSPVRAEIEAADEVVVNGEGSIHHDSGLHNLAVLGAAQRLGKRTHLVNALFQEVSYFHSVISSLDSFRIRDGISLRAAESAGFKATLEADSILAAAWSPDPCIDFDGAVVVTDWHPDRSHDVGIAVNYLLAKDPARYHFLPIKHSIQRYIWQHTVANLRSASLLVTGRYHGVLMAALAGIPFIAMRSNSHKIDAMVEDSGVQFPIWSPGEDLESIIAETLANPQPCKQFADYVGRLPKPLPFSGLGPAGASPVPTVSAAPPKRNASTVYNLKRDHWMFTCPVLEFAREIQQSADSKSKS